MHRHTASRPSPAAEATARLRGRQRLIASAKPAPAPVMPDRRKHSRSSRRRRRSSDTCFLTVLLKGPVSCCDVRPALRSLSGSSRAVVSAIPRSYLRLRAGRSPALAPCSRGPEGWLRFRPLAHGTTGGLKAQSRRAHQSKHLVIKCHVLPRCSLPHKARNRFHVLLPLCDAPKLALWQVCVPPVIRAALDRLSDQIEHLQTQTVPACGM